MSEYSSSEGSPAMNPTGTNQNKGTELRTLTQAEVDQLIKSFIAPLVRQLDDLTRIVQGMITASHPDYYTRTGTAAICRAPGYQPDAH